MPRDLRQLAKSKPCYLRLPEFCRWTPEHTSLMHIRRGNTAGTSQKPEDINGCPGCDQCHAVYDGRLQQDIYTRTQLDAEMLRAHCQWLDWLWKEEIIIAVIAA